MLKLVKGYRLMWNAHSNAGRVRLTLEDNTRDDVMVDSPSELSALGDILRNEKPIWFDTETGEIATGWEPAGEEEDKNNAAG